MLESGIGRAHNVALASLPSFSLPGDLSPSARYWARDIVSPEWTMDAAGTVGVPRDRPGIGVEVDVQRIESLTSRSEVLRATISRGCRVTGALRRTLGFKDLVFLTLGTVIGSGIFLVPAVVLRQTGGSLKIALAVWLIGGLLSFLGALTYAELGAMNPDAGGLYSYIRDAFGPLPAFLYGWASIAVIASGSIAALAVAFSNYLGQLIPIGPVGARIVSVVVIAVIALINIRGTRESSSVENWATATKVGALLVLSIALIALGHGSADTSAPAIVPPTSLFAGLGGAMIGILWAYEGWQYVTFSAGETRDPQRVFPRAIAVATAALIFLYIIANLGYVAALGHERRGGERPRRRPTRCARCLVRCPESSSARSCLCRFSARRTASC